MLLQGCKRTCDWESCGFDGSCILGKLMLKPFTSRWWVWLPKYVPRNDQFSPNWRSTVRFHCCVIGLRGLRSHALTLGFPVNPLIRVEGKGSLNDRSGGRGAVGSVLENELVAPQGALDCRFRHP